MLMGIMDNNNNNNNRNMTTTQLKLVMDKLNEIFFIIFGFGDCALVLPLSKNKKNKTNSMLNLVESNLNKIYYGSFLLENSLYSLFRGS